MGAEFMMSSVYTSTTFGVFTNNSVFPNKFVFSWRDGGHPREQVDRTINARLLKGNHDAICFTGQKLMY
jgi:hypothetical protein